MNDKVTQIDSLIANGPVWHDRFPNMEFSGIDADAFVLKETIADYFVGYADMINRIRVTHWAKSQAKARKYSPEMPDWKPPGSIHWILRPSKF